MKTLLPAAICAAAIALVATSQAEAQYPVTTYYAPNPVATGYYPHAQAYYGATTSYYAPTWPSAVVGRTAYYPATGAYYAAPRAYAYSPTTAYSTYYRAPAAYAPTTAYYGSAAVGYYSPYGGREVRVVGQPIRNAVRAIVP